MEPKNSLSPKSLILKLIEAKNSVLKFWWIVLLFMFVGAAIGFYIDYTLKKRDQYLATIIFSVSGGAQDPTGGLGSLLGMSGGGQGGDASLFSGENLFYMVKTYPVLEQALLTPVELSNGKKELFINYYIDSSYVKPDEWEPYDLPFLKLRIKEGAVPGKLPLLEQQMLDGIVGRIRQETDISVLSTRTSFIELRCKLENEILAKTWAQLLLETVQERYQQNQTRKSRLMYRIMERRADSLARILNSSENQLARVTDLNTLAVDPTVKVQETRIGRKSNFISGLYMETQRTLENLRMSIIKDTPLFTIIEPVHLPLGNVKFDQQNTKFGIAIGLFLAVIVIIFRQTYLDAVQELKPAANKK